MFEFLRRHKQAVAEKPADHVDEVFIQTGSGSFDGVHSFNGFPLTKTNVARKPSKHKGEIECRTCDGDGWDANSGGGVYICSTCRGTGVEDGTALCTCGHAMNQHYLGLYSCHYDDLDLYAEAGHGRILHPRTHGKQPRPCQCEHFCAKASIPEYQCSEGKKAKQ